MAKVAKTRWVREEENFTAKDIQRSAMFPQSFNLKSVEAETMEVYRTYLLDNDSVLVLAQ